MSKYILDNVSHVAHLSVGLTEQCNTDDIAEENRSESDLLPTNFRECKHCTKNVAKNTEPRMTRSGAPDVPHEEVSNGN